MSGELIDIYEDENKPGVFCVSPRDRLGSRFSDFVKANNRGGVIWDRSRSGCQNIISFESIPLLAAAYNEAGFRAVVSDELGERLRGVSIDKSTDDFDARMLDSYCSTDAQMETPEEIRERVESDFEKITGRLDSRGLKLDLHQHSGVKFLKARNKAFLWDDMGLGKTAQALCAIPESNPGVVVVCPSPVRDVWVREAGFWRPEYKVSVPNLSGSGAKVIGQTKTQEFAWPKSGEMIVIAYSQLPLIETIWGSTYGTDKNSVKPKYWFKTVKPILKPLKGTVLIGDEIHKVAGPGSGSNMSQRAVNWTSLSWAVRKCGGYTWGLTGTPLPSKPIQLWRQISRFGLVKPSFGNFDYFKSLFGAYHTMYGLAWPADGPSEEDIPELVESLRKIALRRMKSDVLKGLPALREHKKTVDIGSGQTEINDFLDRMNTFLEENYKGRKTFENMTPTQLFSRMPGFEDFSRIRTLIASAKVDTVLNQIKKHLDIEGIYKSVSRDLSSPSGIAREVNERLEEKRLLVFSANVEPVDKTTEELNKYIKSINSKWKLKIPYWSKVNTQTTRTEKTARVRLFQKKLNAPGGSLLGMSLGIKAGGEGLTLTRATHGFFIDVEWNPGQMEQAIARYHGRNDEITKENIEAGREYTVTYFLLKHPLEKRMHEILKEKQKVISSSIDAMASKPDDEIDYVPVWAYEPQNEASEDEPPIVASLEGIVTTTEIVEEREVSTQKQMAAAKQKLADGKIDELTRSDFVFIQRDWVLKNIRWVSLFYSAPELWVNELRRGHGNYSHSLWKSKAYLIDIFEKGDIPARETRYRSESSIDRWGKFLSELNKSRSQKGVLYRIIGSNEVPREPKTEMEREAYRIAPSFIPNRFDRWDWSDFYDFMTDKKSNGAHADNKLSDYKPKTPGGDSAIHNLRIFALYDAIVNNQPLTNHQFSFLEEVIFGKKIIKIVREEESGLDDFHMPQNGLEEWLMNVAIEMQEMDLDKASVKNDMGWNKAHSPDGHAFANSFHSGFGLNSDLYDRLEKMIKTYRKTQVSDFNDRPKKTDPLSGQERAPQISEQSKKKIKKTTEELKPLMESEVEKKAKSTEEMIFAHKLRENRSFNQLDAWNWTKHLKIGDEVEVRWTSSGESYSAKRARVIKILKNLIRVELLEFYGEPYSGFPVGSNVSVPYGKLTSKRSMTWDNGVFPVGWMSKEDQERLERTHKALDEAIASSRSKSSNYEAEDAEAAEAEERSRRETQFRHDAAKEYLGKTFVITQGGYSNVYAVMTKISDVERLAFGWHFSADLTVLPEPSPVHYKAGEKVSLDTFPIRAYDGASGIGIFHIKPEDLRKELDFELKRGLISEKTQRIMGIWKEPKKTDLPEKTFSVGDIVRDTTDRKTIAYVVLDAAGEDGYVSLYPLTDPELDSWNKSLEDLVQESKNLERLDSKYDDDHNTPFYGSGAGDLWDSFVEFISTQFLADPERSDVALKQWDVVNKNGFKGYIISEHESDPFKIRHIIGRKRRQKAEAQKEVQILFTTADESYDYSFVKTLENDCGLDSRGRPFRKVAVEKDRLSTQVKRYWSGNHRPWDEDEFLKMKEDGLVRPMVEPVEDENVTRFKAIVAATGFGERISNGDIERALEEAEEAGLLSQFVEWSRDQSFIPGFAERLEIVYDEFKSEPAFVDEPSQLRSGFDHAEDGANWLFKEIRDYFLRHLDIDYEEIRRAAFFKVDLPREPGSFTAVSGKQREKARRFLASGLKSLKKELSMKDSSSPSSAYSEDLLDDVVEIAWYWPDSPSEMVGDELVSLDELPEVDTASEMVIPEFKEELPVLRPIVAGEFLDDIFRAAWTNVLEPAQLADKSYYDSLTQRIKPDLERSFREMFLKINASLALKWISDISPNVFLVANLRRAWQVFVSDESQTSLEQVRLVVSGVDDIFCHGSNSSNCGKWKIARKHLSDYFAVSTTRALSPMSAKDDSSVVPFQSEDDIDGTWVSDLNLELGQVYYLTNYKHQGNGRFFRLDSHNGTGQFAGMSLHPVHATEPTVRVFSRGTFQDLDGNFNKHDKFPSPDEDLIMKIKVFKDYGEFWPSFSVWEDNFELGKRRSFKTESGAIKAILKDMSRLAERYTKAGWNVVVEYPDGSRHPFWEAPKKTLSTKKSKPSVKKSQKPVESSDSRAKEFESGLMSALGGALDDLLGSL